MADGDVDVGQFGAGEAGNVALEEISYGVCGLGDPGAESDHEAKRDAEAVGVGRIFG